MPQREAPKAVAAARVPLREEQRQLTRQRLLKAAEQAFRSRGFSATTLDDIAALAGVNRGTIYLHHQNKAQLLLALLTNKSRDFAAGYDHLMGAHSREELEAVFESIISWWSDQYSFLLVLMREAATVDTDINTWMLAQRQRHIARISAVLESRGLKRDMANARAFVLSSAWTEIICRLYAGEVDLGPGELRDALVDLFEVASVSHSPDSRALAVRPARRAKKSQQQIVSKRKRPL